MEQQSNFPLTLLSRQAHFSIPIALAIYVITLTGFWLNDHYSVQPICAAGAFSRSIDDFSLVLFGAFFGLTFMKGFKLILAAVSQRKRSDSHAAILFLFFIMMLTNFFHSFAPAREALFSSYVCVNSLGIKTTVFQWADWMVSVPFMFYLTISFDGRKTHLNAEDSAVLALISTSVLAQFLPIVVKDRTYCYISLIYSTISTFAALFRSYQHAKMSQEELARLDSTSPSAIVIQKIAAGRLNCCIYLGLLTIFINLIAGLHGTGWFSFEVSYMIYLNLTMTIKVVFAIFILQEHTELLDHNSFKLLQERIANEARRNFLRYVFHEVRVPLNSISLGLPLLYAEACNSNATVVENNRETFDMMFESVNFMTQTLNDVLSIQKIEEGQIELCCEPFMIPSVIRTAKSSLQGQCQAKNITIDVFIEPNVPQAVYGDRFRIEHVMANLLSNATKFSPVGSTIKVHVSMVEQQQVRFSVFDKGIGISEQDQHSLFNHYVQINPGANQAGQGTGVGLVICKEIVELHGGRIGCHSTVRQGDDIDSGGSEFYFIIPFKPCTDAALLKAHLNHSCESLSDLENSEYISDSASDHSQAFRTDVSIFHFKALVVDDVPSNRKILRSLLERKGLACDMVADGFECIRTISSKGIGFYDIIFLDNLMPGMNGTDVAQVLRDQGYENIIAGLTGKALNEDIQDFIDHGADIVFAKPLSLTDLDYFLETCSRLGIKSVDFVLDLPGTPPVPVDTS